MASPFSFTRGVNNKVIRKNVTFTATPKVNNNSFALANSNLNLSVLSLSGQPVTADANQLNFTSSVIPGTGAANKALVLDSNNDISNINTLTCNALIVNGNNIVLTSSGETVSGESNSPYLQGIKLGVSAPNKALVLDTSRNIKNIDSLGVTELNYNNNKITNTTTTIIKKKVYPFSWIENSTTYTNNIIASVWSSELSLGVALSNTGTNNRILTTNNGTSWTIQNTPTDRNWTALTWSPELSLFVAVATETYIGTPPTPPSNHAMTSNNSNNLIASASSKLSDDTGSPSDALIWDPWNAFDTDNTKAWHSGTNATKKYNSSTGIYEGNTITIDSNNIQYSGEWLQIQFSSAFILGSFNITPRSGLEATRSPRNFVVLGSNNGTSWNLVFTQINKQNWTFTANSFTAGTSTAYSYYRLVTTRVGHLDSGMAGAETVQIANWVLIEKFDYNIIDIMTSPDAITWTGRKSFVPGSWTSICWSPQLSLFIAVGNAQTNRIMSSSDGINWIPRSTTNVALASVCWSPQLSLFVAVGTNTVLTSPDGINWTTRTITANTWKSVIWVSELRLFITVSTTGTGNRIATSTDGFTWTTRTSPADNNWESLTWAPDLNLAIAVSSTGTNRIIYSENGIEWYLHSSNIATPLRSIIWANNSSRFIILATNNIYTSNIFDQTTLFNDLGLNYKALLNNNNILSYSLTNSNAIITNTPNKVIWVKELNSYFILTTNTTGLIYRSSDGINWTSVSINTTTQMMSIAWSPSLNLLVIIGTNFIITSSDGFTWIPQNAPTTPSNNNWIDITWSPKLALFIAVSSGATGTNSATDRIMTSPDGNTWTIRSSSVSSGVWRAIVWSPELEMLVVTGDNVIMYSYNGITWTNRNLLTGSAGTSTSFTSVCWSPDLYLFVAINTNDRVIISRNGIDWHYRTISTGSWSSICWAAGLSHFMACNSSNLIISNDGNIWRSVSFSTVNGVRITWSPELNNFLMCDTNKIVSLNNSKYGNRLPLNNNNLNYLQLNNIYSTTYKNPIIYNNWNLVNTNLSNEWTSIVYASDINLLVAIASSGLGNRVMTSSDGFTWTPRTSASDNNWTSVCWSSNLDLFVAVASSGTGNRVMTSSDGITWTSRTSASDNNWTSVCWASKLNLFVAVASSGTGNRVMTSTDGITWTSRTSATNNDWTSICYSLELNLLVAVASTGIGNRVMTSQDGINWTSRTSAVDNNWTSICWADTIELFIAVSSSGTGNRIMTSSDGIAWITRNSPADNNWSSISWSSEMNMIMGISNSGSNRIMLSTNGIDWYIKTTPENHPWSSICWSDLLSEFIMISTNGYITYSNPGVDSILSNVIKNSNSQININQNRLYFNTTSGLLTLNIGQTTNSHYLRLSYNNSNTNSVDFSGVDSTTAQLNITNNSANKITNIVNHNGSTFGLAFNDVLLPLTSSNLNKLNLTTSGVAEGNKALVLNNQSSISNINNLTVNTLLVNNKLILNETDNNNPYFSNITPGTVLASKVLTVDANKNIGTLNNIQINNFKLNSVTNINSKFNSTTYNPITRFTSNFKSTYTYPSYMQSLSIAWSPELNLFVATEAVSTSAVWPYLIHISSDGLNWNSVFIPGTTQNSRLNSVCWSSELRLFVIVGRSTPSTLSLILTSDNGLDWTVRTSPSISMTWNAVCWSSDLLLFVAVGNNAIMTSPDGIIWTSRTSPVANTWTSVCWGGLNNAKLFVAVSNTGAGNRIMTSSDGITWTSRTSTADHAWSSVIWANFSTNPLFIAVANTSTTTNIMTSSNGTSWSSRTSPSSDTTWRSIVYADAPISAAFAVSGTGNNNRIITSTNGTTWTTISTANRNLQFNFIAYSPTLNRLVASGVIESTYNYNSMITSINGSSWDFVDTNYDIWWHDLIYINELSLFIAVSNSDNSYCKQIATSTNGEDWTLRNINNTGSFPARFRNITWSSSLGLAVICYGPSSGSSNTFYRSSDGINWISTTVPSQTWLNVEWIPFANKFIAVGNTTFAISTDGINWSSLNSGSNTSLHSIDFASSLNMIIATSNSQYVTSIDGGVTWTLRSLVVSGSNRSLSGETNITWISQLGLFIYTSSDNSTYFYSYNGITWTESRFRVTLGGNNIDFALRITTSKPVWISKFNKLYILSNWQSEVAELFESSDGITWNNYYSLPTKHTNYCNLCWADAIETLIGYGFDSRSTPIEPFLVLNKYLNPGVNYNLSAIKKTSNIKPSAINESTNNWISRTSSEDNSWNSICYSNELNIFASISSSGNNRVMTSSDSITWTSRTIVSIRSNNGLSTIDSGWGHGLVILEDGTVRTWGNNNQGQLGNGNTTNQNVPVTLSGTAITNAIAVAAGDDHSLILLADKTVRTFGWNSNGQLGNGNTIRQPTPVTLAGTAINNANGIAAGREFSLILLENGSIRSMGINNSGQLGNNTTTNSSTPVAVNNISTAIAIATGSNHSLALLSNGRIMAWGINTYGQLGDTSSTTRLQPVEVSGITNAVAIAACYECSFALLSDGTVRSWGRNNFGQLGRGSINNNVNSTPIQIPNLTNVVSIFGGFDNALAILENSNVVGWGSNVYGQLNSTNVGGTFSSPVAVNLINNAVCITSGAWHSYVVLLDGTIRAFGDGTLGQMGNGTITTSTTPTTVLTASGTTNPLVIRLNVDTSINLNNWNSLCWSPKLSTFVGVASTGNNRLVRSTNGLNWLAFKAPVNNNWTSVCWSPTLELFVAVANSGNDRVMISSNGIDWEVRTGLPNNWTSICYSDELNLFAAVANSGTNDRVMTSSNGLTWTSRITPVITLSAQPTYIKYISAGESHSIALMSDGTVRTWGDNYYGQLGNNSTTQRTTPITVPNLSNVIAVACQNNTTFALLSDGTIKGWGSNQYGNVGDNTDWNDRLIPTNVSGISNAIHIECGSMHSIALLSDGSVRTWGYNAGGQLGNDSTTNSLIPIQVNNIANVIDISAGSDHTMVLLNDGTVKTWGYNDSGQLGNGSTTTSLVPVSVLNLSNVKKISAGSGHSLALLNDGTVKSWGSNFWGELGNGSNPTFVSESTIPVTVSNLSNVKDIDGGYQFSLALLEDGTIRSWGKNSAGKLGNNSSENSLSYSNVPVSVSTITNGNSISAGMYNHAIAILDGGTIMTWGNNEKGQLGNNSTTDSLIPVSVHTSSSDSTPLTNAKLVQSSSGSTTYNDWTSICWSPELSLFVAVASTGIGNRVMTSSDGITWTSRNTPADNEWTSVVWAKELGIFIAVAKTGTNNRIMISRNGINWTLKNNGVNNDWTSICWSSGYNLAVAVSSSGSNNRVLTSTLALPYLQSQDYLLEDSLYVNQSNGLVGLGTTNPTFQLELSTNSAAKPSTAFWSTSSDKRLKENIENADLDKCLDIINNLKLVKYKWKDFYANEHQLDTTTQLGWLADDVEKVLPKAIRIINSYNLSDCKTLDSDQIIASMYGALKKILLEYEDYNDKINNLKNEIKTMKDFINQFDLN